uniref:Uncharacterized protein n=1 Tax=Rhizophora mucronata TaxID=61149 RepID=A0A2P2M278_RHIMU
MEGHRWKLTCICGFAYWLEELELYSIRKRGKSLQIGNCFLLITVCACVLFCSFVYGMP